MRIPTSSDPFFFICIERKTCTEELLLRVKTKCSVQVLESVTNTVVYKTLGFLTKVNGSFSVDCFDGRR